ncbi:MAG: efflux RND transporter periplasmic adaptor subunit [Anaerolineales bacterium]|nr:efflux RND transporter periplasmic adaptor subunit [Anaerolineales bacterium]
MKTNRGFLVLLTIVVIAGCGQAPAETPAPAVTEAAPPEIKSISGQVIASGEVVPVLTSELSFSIAGPVKDITVKAGDVVKAGQPLVSLDMPALEGAIPQAEASIRGLQADVNYYSVSRKYKPPERRELAEARVAEAQAVLASAQASLAQATMQAPFDGTIVSIEVQPGEMVQPGQVVILLANLENLQIETTDLSELNIAQVRVGQDATVYIEALDQEFPGSVTQIAPRATEKSGDLVFMVTITLDKTLPDLRWGMSTEVNIDVK